jgi:hypothetical protein
MRSLLNCLLDKLTLMKSGGSHGNIFCHRCICMQASRNTHSPSGTISPVSSATGMKSIGEMKPRSGCCHRTRASKPRRAKPSRPTMGW